MPSCSYRPVPQLLTEKGQTPCPLTSAPLIILTGDKATLSSTFLSKAGSSQQHSSHPPPAPCHQPPLATNVIRERTRRIPPGVMEREPQASPWLEVCQDGSLEGHVFLHVHGELSSMSYPSGSSGVKGYPARRWKVLVRVARAPGWYQGAGTRGPDTEG